MIEQLVVEFHGDIRVGVVTDGGGDLDGGGLRGNLRGGDERAIAIDTHGFGGGQVDVAVDARAGIPAGIGKIVVVIDADGEDIVAALVEVRREVVFERSIAVRAFAEFVAVQVDGGVLVDAVEAEDECFVLLVGGEGEVLAIPGDAAGKEAGATGPFSIEGLFDGPVAGEIELAPGGVIQGGGASAPAGSSRLKSQPSVKSVCCVSPAASDGEARRLLECGTPPDMRRPGGGTGEAAGGRKGGAAWVRPFVRGAVV